jgi:lysozyme family protein
MANVTQLKKANATRWQNVQITSNLISAVDKIAARLVAPTAKTRYQSVATKTKVP